jgi:2-amino-4-hydroxy-6-hydroxymethyldihydropteridine diphosphokinase
VPRCEPLPRAGEELLQRAGAGSGRDGVGSARSGSAVPGSGRAMQDEDGHFAHARILRPMHRVRAYIGLGANLGDAAGTLAAGVATLAALPGARLVGVSRLYATEPVGVMDQPEFRNAVAALDVRAGPDPEMGALALLIACKGLERAFGRREWGRWGPRELDLDLLVFGRHRIRVERPRSARSDDPSRPGVQWLEVPHAAARERLFVLAPLADLAPGLRPPGWGETVASARARAAAANGPDAVRVIATWDRTAGEWDRTGRARSPGELNVGSDVAP